MYQNPSDFPQRGGFSPHAIPGATPASNMMTQVYQWMAIGLGLTGATAMLLQSQPELLSLILGTPLRWVLLLATIGMSVALQGFAMRMSAPVAFVVFFLFAGLMGVS